MKYFLETELMNSMNSLHGTLFTHLYESFRVLQLFIKSKNNENVFPYEAKLILIKHNFLNYIVTKQLDL